MNTLNLEVVDHIISELYNAIWDLDDEEKEYLRNNRPTLYEYLMEMGVIFEEDEE